MQSGDFTESQNCKTCHTGVELKGKPLERLLSCRFGTQRRTPMDNLHQGFGGKEAEKETTVKIKKKNSLIKENRGQN